MYPACRPVILFLFFIFQFVYTGAQTTGNELPASLLRKIQTSNPDSNCLVLYLKLGNYYIDKEGYEKNDLDSANKIVLKAEKLGKALNNIKWNHEVEMFSGRYYLESGDTSTGYSRFRNVIAFYQTNHDRKSEADTWLKLGESIPYLDHNFTEEKIKNYNHAKLLYGLSGNKLEELHAYNLIAEAHGTDGQLKPALAEFESLLNQYKVLHYQNLQDIYGWLAYLNKSNGQISKALAFDIEAVKSMEATSDSNGAPMHYAHLGCTYAELGMKDKGLLYLKRSIDICRHRPGTPYIHYYLSIAVACMVKVEGPRKALAYLESTSAQIPPLSLSQKYYVYQSYAYCYKKLGNYSEAEKYYLKYIQCMDTLFAKKQEDEYSLFMAYNDICSFYVSTGEFKKASIYIKKIEQMPAGMKNSMSLSEFQKLEFKVDSANGNYSAAIRHLLLFKQMQDSLFSSAKSKQIEELNIHYETDKKDKDLLLKSKNIQLLTNQTRLQQVQVNQSKLSRNAVICGAGLLLVLLAVGYSRYIIKQEKNHQLEVKQKEISAKNTKLEKLLHENEWLMREVHHRVKNNLQIVMSLLNSQTAYLKDEAALSAMLESQQRVQSMSLIHQKLYKSSNVSTINMQEYICDMVDYLKDSFKTKASIYFDLQIEDIELDVLQAVPVGLILNEVITNSIKYAFPFSNDDKISIRLSRAANLKDICLVISDNGRGLPANFTIEESKSFGIILINGLAEDLEGTCFITSCNGTTVSLKFTGIAVGAKQPGTKQSGVPI